ncbi:MAG: hypothetical protein DRR06_04125 [Gammaproteobacteria bacterium]|nr:MAG: hypothetical protein DRR06_04125 [Gammaproteobacteria bacterium]RLA54967.1 MAG: hypothetical protein DRR42_00255 [Gammaproteobacteria bacterium]
MRRINLAVILLVSLLTISPLNADDVCREKDSHGNVQFIDCAAAGKGAKPVEIKDANVVSPAEFIVDEPATPKAANNSGQGNSKGNSAGNKRTQLEQANRELEEAKQVREGDRQKTKSGSRLNESYHQRVRQAEEKVKSLQ